MADLPTIAPSIRCRCGHSAPWQKFYEDGFGGELPPNHHRCPACGWQWRRVRIPRDQRSWKNNYAPIRIETITAPVL